MIQIRDENGRVGEFSLCIFLFGVLSIQAVDLAFSCLCLTYLLRHNYFSISYELHVYVDRC